MSSRSIRLSAIIVCAAAALPAFAQTDSVATAHQAAANQLGMLEYCRGRGDVDNAAVDAERESIARLPPSSVDTSAAEALGRAGTMSMMGNTTTLAAMASQRNSSVGVVCKQMGDAAIQTAAAFKGNAAFGGGMPGFGTMPAMPPGMTLPPGMTMPPGMPGMPPARTLPAR